MYKKIDFIVQFFILKTGYNVGRQTGHNS